MSSPIRVHRRDPTMFITVYVGDGQLRINHPAAFEASIASDERAAKELRSMSEGTCHLLSALRER